MPIKDLERRRQYNREYRIKNKERIKNLNWEWRRVHPDQIKEYEHNRNKAKKSAKDQRYRIRYLEEIKIAQRKWRFANPEKVKFLNYRKQFKRRNGISLEEWNNIKRRFDFKCQICNLSEPEIELTVDHIIPLSKNGSLEILNIQPLCRSCNGRKSNRN